MNHLIQLFSPVSALFVLILSFIYPLLVLLWPQIGDVINNKFRKVCDELKTSKVLSSVERDYFNRIHTIVLNLLFILFAIILLIDNIGLNGNLIVGMFILIIVYLFIREGNTLSVNQTLRELVKGLVPFAAFMCMLYVINVDIKYVTYRHLTVINLILYVVWKREAMISLMKAFFAAIINIVLKCLFCLCLITNKEKPFDALMWFIGAISIPTVIQEIIK